VSFAEAAFRERCSSASSGVVKVAILHAWLRWRIGKDFGREEGGSDDEVEEVMRFELRCVSEFLGLGHHGGAMDGGEEALDAEEEALGIARNVVYGAPGVSKDPVPVDDIGRFVRSHPLEFPLGIGDLNEPRPWPVTVHEWAQHLLRYHSGHFAQGTRGHRVVWAIVNKVLLMEARGKGYAVQRNVMRRMGCHAGGAELVTRGELRRMMESPDGVRSLVHQLMTVG
jgi:hypothetical protein